MKTPDFSDFIVAAEQIGVRLCVLALKCQTPDCKSDILIRVPLESAISTQRVMYQMDLKLWDSERCVCPDCLEKEAADTARYDAEQYDKEGV